MRRSPSSPSNPLGSLPQASVVNHPKNGEAFPVWSVLICGSMYVCMYVYIYTVYIYVYIYALYVYILIYIYVCMSNYTVWFYLYKPLHLCILIHSYRIWKISWILAFFSHENSRLGEVRQRCQGPVAFLGVIPWGYETI
jgi:hypothetical protein